ncbi:FAD-binding oxidoreductase [Afifella sp. JA880]|uniref:NAD(P)/FAD-dependent oxidoreductase n=1 Tax=Afifella sp. JA880 TaxID=2975280 RepID=UPI0021BB1081|nr:FAD-binding oxidoreductase [Afifella sp. JA880]MCT8266493.1 FAD-binding oxidoreductase [Afifella sp. JA880]
MQILPSPSRTSYDVIIIGAGFYGLALAAHLGKAGRKVLICEIAQEAMGRASKVNQARVHAGFHYPRSFATALRSCHNFEPFVDEFRPAIVSDFQMLYAIARYRTRVNARRFHGMFDAMGAPLRPALPAHRALFSNDLVEDVFACTEYAFDYSVLRDILFSRLGSFPVDLVFRTEVAEVAPGKGEGIVVTLADGRIVEAGQVFNITYSQINEVLRGSGLKPLPLKHELVEIAIIDPPAELGGVAVTVMDGAFFSSMPFPAANAYSLTHVRYTPHFGWTDENAVESAYQTARRLPHETRWRHMVNDARRYLPALAEARWRMSLFDVKTVPVKNEADDGRPILLHAHSEIPGLWSVLGSKIDNIYDLYDAVG